MPSGGGIKIKEKEKEHDIKEKEKEKETREKEKEKVTKDKVKERSLMGNQTTANRIGPGHLIGGVHLHGIRIPRHLRLIGQALLRWTLEL